MLQSPPFLIYKSSAGSGKTYTIAKEYLKLALSAPKYFKGILAVTFTNKAADEMKDRVLSFLKAFSNGEESPLMKELEDYFHCDANEIKKRAEEVLGNILHDYSNFAITTIDTFFNQVIRTFTREIGLQGGFDIEMDLDDVLTEIIDKMLASLHEDDELRKWLVDFAIERLREGKSYEFREEIRNLARQLFQEQYKELESSLSGLSVERKTLKDLSNYLVDITNDFEDKLKEFGEEALSEIKKNGLSVDDFSSGKSGVAGQFIKWEKGDFSTPGKRVMDALEDPAKWFAKKSIVKDQIESLVNQSLMTTLQEGYDFYLSHISAYRTAVEVNKYLYTFGLLNDLTIKIREYREEHEVILISDLPQFLKQIIDDSDAPYIYEKIGNRYHHFLIDEFQDTSAFQWGNFKPLVSNSLASGNFNMVVGDVKQSIYRWRGGNAELLLHQVATDVGKEQVSEKFLDVNYRSHEQVIQFNNELFQVTPFLLRDFLKNELSDLPKGLQNKLQDRLQHLVQSYEGVAQDVPSFAKSEGYINVSFTPKPKRGENETWDDLAIKWTIAQVEILQQNGNSLKDIAILVRDSGQENKLVEAFGIYKQSDQIVPDCSYEVISAQAMYLTNAAVVNFLVAVFKYLNNQKEHIALIEVIYEYQVNILQNEIALNELFTNDMSNFLPESFVKYIHVLGRFPLYELTEILIRIFQLNEKEGELAYLQAFQDAILEYSKHEKGDLHSFLHWWGLKGKKRTVQFSENLEAIKILTIHKSKGLQYRNLIVPFCQWGMDHNAIFSNILWTQNLEEEPYNSLPAIPLRYSSVLKDSLFSEKYFDEKIKAHTDNLNLLYVALTRAEQNLLIHAQVPAKSRKQGDISLISDLMWDFLKTLPDFNEEENRYEKGNMVQCEETISETDESEEVYLKEYMSSKWRNKLSVKKQAGDYFEIEEAAQKLSVNLLALTRQILKEIEHKDQLETAIHASHMEMKITSEDADKLLKNVKKVLEHPLINSWYSGKYEVRNEVIVLPKDGQLKRLDRVLLDDDIATVIDFKITKANEVDKLQLLYYTDLLKQMGYAKVKGYLVYLGDVNVVEVK